MDASIEYLQRYIRSKDFYPELKREYFMCLAEETGEVGRAMRKDLPVSGEGEAVKGTIAEELWDVMYYCIAIANLYDIDLNQVIRDKEALNNAKYQNDVTYNPQ